ncbi:helix-turn-helix transcriptional regulator [Bradyrhizobium hipponense]|uniref:helix-turn-helix transcriptional regulator n=1 Tax=Bradyrhizobium hipponense TaxID=2605638 RepID=UPI001F3341DA|nr:transcriptional regulator [Bradyrhizobium hipponense]
MSQKQEIPGYIEGDRVLSFDDWCKLNGFSRSTGQRLIAAGNGPQFIKLSERRKGVTVAENRRWQASRLIETAA